MPETFEQMVDRVLRDHEAYSGDGAGGNGALPVGDRSSAAKPISKRDMRALLKAPVSFAMRAEKGAEDAEAVVGGLGTLQSAVNQAAAEKAAAEAARIAAQAAADASIQAGQWDQEVADAAARLALTGLAANWQVYQLDTEHVWRWDGSAWVDRGESPLALKADRDTLISIIQSIGYGGEIPNGTSNTFTGTYTLTTQIEKSGKGIRFAYYGGGSGTAYVQIASRSGDVITIEDEVSVSISSGYHVIDLPDLSYEAGDYVGFRAASGLVRISNASPGYGYWSVAGELISKGNTYTVSSAPTNVAFHMRFEFWDQVVTAADYMATKQLLDETTVAVGTADLDDVVIGRPASDTLTTGSNLGSINYLIEYVAPYDIHLSKLRVYGLSAGVIQLSSWSGSSSSIVRDKVVDVPIGVGDNEIENVGLFLRKGQRFGIQRGTAGIAINNAGAGVVATPYRSISGTGGTPGALTSSVRFEVSAEFEPWGLLERVTTLEGGEDQTLPLPDTFHIHLALGESHVAGRSTVRSAIEVPEGAGYAYRRTTETLDHLQDPTGNDSTAIASSGRGSFFPALGRQIWEMSHGRVGAIIVNSGLGSTTVGNHWATGGGAWDQAVEDWVTALAEAHSDGLIISGVSISIAIGSNDASAGTSKSTFKAALIDLIERARDLVGGGVDVPVVLVQTGPFTSGSSSSAIAAIQQAQAEIAQEELGVYMGYSARFSVARSQMIDDVHFNQTFNDACGRAMAIPALMHGAGLYPAGLD